MSNNSPTMNYISHEQDVTMDGDQMVFNPYNPENIEITEKDVQSILSQYGVPGKVENLNLYKRAFIHRSYVKRPSIENDRNNITIVERPDDCLTLKTKSNERLEFLGDGVLECITKYYLYRRFPKENEGFMTEKKIALVKNEHIGRLAYEMGLHKWYILSRHSEEKKTRTNLKKLGCLFEAFLGALFLDFNKQTIKDEEDWFNNVFVTGPGFQIAQIFVEKVFEKHVDWMKLISEDTNYKNILQVQIQKEFKCTPTYLILNEDDETGYTMGVYLAKNIQVQNIKPEYADDYENTMVSFAILHERLEQDGKVFVKLAESAHKIKKKAEQEACMLALDKLLRG